MPSLKVFLKRIKKPFLVGIYILIFLLLSFVALHLTSGSAKQIIENALDKFYVLLVFMGAMSFALFNNIDTIQKDISALKVEPSKIRDVINKLSILKKEVIQNAFLIFALFLIDIGIKEVQALSIAIEYFEWVMLSVRFANFALAILAVFLQFRGFVTATEFRDFIIPREK